MAVLKFHHIYYKFIYYIASMTNYQCHYKPFVNNNGLLFIPVPDILKIHKMEFDLLSCIRMP